MITNDMTTNDMTTNDNDCSELPGRLRDICLGVADLPLWKINRYRKQWDLPALTRRGTVAAPKTGKRFALSHGPGSQLVMIYTRRGMPSCQACHDLAAKMDGWGVDECRKRINEIVAEILPRAKNWLVSNKPWVHRVLEGVGLEDTAIRTVIRRDLLAAIKTAKDYATRPGVAAHPFRRRRSASSRPAFGRVETESLAVVVDPIWRTEPKYVALGQQLLTRSEIIIKSFLRHRALFRCVQSIRKFYPDVAIRVIDDSFRDGKTNDDAERIKQLPGVTWNQMPFDSGLSAGRNHGVRNSPAEFIILCDDDMLFIPQTDLTALLVGLHETGVDIFGGLSRRNGRGASNWCGHLTKKRSVLVMTPLHTPVEVIAGIRFRRSDITYNFFAARRRFLLDHPWDNQFKIGGEHLDSFLTWKAAGAKVAFTVDCVCDETGVDNSPEYRAFRRRTTSYAVLNKKHGIITRRTIGTIRFPGV